MEPKPPTSSLPPIRDINLISHSTIVAALINIRALYWPSSLMGAAIRARKWDPQGQDIPDSGYASAEEEEEDIAVGFEERLSLLRSDPFERAFTVRWLTGLIARSQAWSQVGEELLDRTGVMEEAAALLAFMADTHADGVLTRRFSFSVQGGEVISVELKDEPYDTDHESVGLQTWSSASVLAERICADPVKYLGLDSSPKTIKILELGAGTGLLSIMLGKLQSCRCIRDRGITFEIAATDFHQAVLKNLQGNIARNFHITAGLIRVLTLDWSEPPVLRDVDKYDLIFAADVIYDQRHGAWIKNCSEKLLRSAERSSMWMIVACRPTRTTEVQGIDDVFARIGTNSLTIIKDEHISRHPGIGRADEDGYRLFEIAWAYDVSAI